MRKGKWQWSEVLPEFIPCRYSQRSQFGQQTRSDVSEFGAASSADEDSFQFSRIYRLRPSSC